MVALVFLGLNGLRVAIAAAFGLYPSSTVGLLSVAAALPAVGVVIGKRLRRAISPQARRILILGLLTVVGFRLITGGFGIV